MKSYSYIADRYKYKPRPDYFGIERTRLQYVFYDKFRIDPRTNDFVKIGCCAVDGTGLTVYDNTSAELVNRMELFARSRITEKELKRQCKL